MCSSGVPLAVVCSFERKGCGSTLGQQELAVACACVRVSGGVGVDPSVAVAAVAVASAFVPAYASSDVYACAYVRAQNMLIRGRRTLIHVVILKSLTVLARISALILKSLTVLARISALILSSLTAQIRITKCISNAVIFLVIRPPVKTSDVFIDIYKIISETSFWFRCSRKPAL